MNKFYSLVALFLLAFASLSFVSAGDAPILRSVPQQNIWVADGVTEYTIDFFADNTPLNGATTRGIDIEYIIPVVQGYNFQVVEIDVEPTINDFFEGFTPVSSPEISTNSFGRMIFEGSQGPVNTQGIVGSLKVVVTKSGNGPSFAQTSWNFNSDPEKTHFVDMTWSTINPQLESVAFTVQDPNYHVVNPAQIHSTSVGRVRVASNPLCVPGQGNC